ncbi:MAG TPA: type VII secretion-associated serine protease mycosin [Pseudonocardiaceae bacterium]|jgi:membrane-anchored mycosin MYCP
MFRLTPRKRGVPYRLAATSVAAGLVLIGPAAWPAYAAGSSPIGDPPATPSTWEPPPVDSSLQPAIPPTGGTPDGNYTLSQSGSGGCLTSGVTQALLTEPDAQKMLNIAGAQKISTGAGVTVAVIDTGVNPHPMFGTRLLNGGDYIENDGKGTHDCDGHGTMVAGIIAADTRGTPYNFIGVAPDAKILAIRQTDSNYTDQTNNNQAAGDLKTLGEAIMYAASRPDVKVITMSVDNCNPVAGGLAKDEENKADARALQAAIDYAVNKQDKVVIAAAGNIPNGNTADQSSQGGGTSQQSSNNPCSSVPQNDNPDVNAVKQVEIPPVYSNNVISVASVSPETGDPSIFTEWGPWVTVAAPGEQIISVDPAPGGSMLTNETVQGGKQVNNIQGTSFAAPYVAGLAALIRSKYPTLTARQVMYRIEVTAQHPSGPDGRNNQVGYGLINPVAALTASIPGQNGGPPAQTTTIKAQVPNAGADDGLPMQVALIGAGGTVLVLFVIYFVMRTRRHSLAKRS